MNITDAQHIAALDAEIALLRRELESMKELWREAAADADSYARENLRMEARLEAHSDLVTIGTIAVELLKREMARVGHDGEHESIAERILREAQDLFDAAVETSNTANHDSEPEDDTTV